MLMGAQQGGMSYPRQRQEEAERRGIDRQPTSGVDFSTGREARMPDQSSPEYQQLVERMRNSRGQSNF
jgi:hypothetical protein